MAGVKAIEQRNTHVQTIKIKCYLQDEKERSPAAYLTAVRSDQEILKSTRGFVASLFGLLEQFWCSMLLLFM